LVKQSKKGNKKETNTYIKGDIKIMDPSTIITQKATIIRQIIDKLEYIPTMKRARYWNEQMPYINKQDLDKLPVDIKDDYQRMFKEISGHNITFKPHKHNWISSMWYIVLSTAVSTAIIFSIWTILSQT